MRNMENIEMVFASHNKYKLQEMEYLLNYEEDESSYKNTFSIKLLSLDDVNFKEEIEENGKNFFENAKIKALTIRNATGRLSLSDDSGLCVSCLDGAPGIYSARYAGENATSDDNINKLLDQLKDVPYEDRKAKFVCVLCTALPGDNHFYTMGECEGYISQERVGTNGFGYDPIFFSIDRYKSFGHMTEQEKNTCSHRYLAIKKLKEKLSSGLYI